MENFQNKKPVVMQIIPALESGGVERGVIDVVKALKKDDFEPIVISKGGVLVYQLKEAGIKHFALSVHSKNPLIIFLNIKKIVKIIQENQVDVVHVRSRAPMWSAYFACKKTGTKLVSTIHGTYSLNLFHWKVFPLKRIYNAMMLKADAIIVVSNFIKKYLAENYQGICGNFLEKVSVIQRGADLGYFNYSKVSKNRIIDLSKKWNLPEDKKIILMPARFTSWKGHEFLIDALTKVQNDFFCVMVGSDHGHKKFRKKIENKIVKENLAGKIKIVGLCKDMPAAYAVSHVAVCPSIRPEAFGRISIEAQASSKIIIATKIGGSLETVIEGKTGFLVDVGDAEQLAQLIDKTLSMSKSEADEMGIAARKNIEENFSNEKMCSETISVYKFLLNPHPSL
jgi:glycosyltransferase involved in cell wall biosynthesis